MNIILDRQAKQELNFLSSSVMSVKMNDCKLSILAEPETSSSHDSSSLSSEWPKFLGKGTYGSVWKIDEKNVKKRTKMFEHSVNNIISPTLREICFLNTFGHSHIRPLSSIKWKDDHIHLSLIMPDAGMTLSDWCKSTSGDIRLHIIPYIVIQILSVLVFLEKHGISHGDLKPWNILINENFYVFVIDWGASCIIPCFNPERGCTDEFAAPELMEPEAQNGCPADIFSLGLIIRFLVYGKFESSEWILDQCYNRGFVPIMKSSDLIRRQKSIELIKKFQPLLVADPAKRPKASDIMNWEELKVYRHYLQENTIQENVNYNILPICAEDWKKFKSLSLDDRRSTIIWFFESIRGHYLFQFFPFAVELMDQFVIRKGPADINKRQLCFVLLACFCISNSLFGSSLVHSDLVSSKTNSQIFDQLRETIFHILGEMEWNIYFPIWNKSIKNLDTEAMLKILIDGNMIGVSQEEKLLSYGLLKLESEFSSPTIHLDSEAESVGKKEKEVEKDE